MRFHFRSDYHATSNLCHWKWSFQDNVMQIGSWHLAFHLCSFLSLGRWRICSQISKIHKQKIYCCRSWCTIFLELMKVHIDKCCRLKHFTDQAIGLMCKTTKQTRRSIEDVARILSPPVAGWDRGQANGRGIHGVWVIGGSWGHGQGSGRNGETMLRLTEVKSSSA